MDPITIILTALVTGAAAGLKPTVEQVVKDAYGGIKALIKQKYPRVSVDNLEHDPTSEARKGVVLEDLQKVKAGEDPELLLMAQAVLEAVRQHAPEAARAVGVSIEELQAQSLRVRDIVVASGTGVRIAKSTIGGDVDISGVRVGDGGSKA
jgi:hypothetical protein